MKFKMKLFKPKTPKPPQPTPEIVLLKFHAEGGGLFNHGEKYVFTTLAVVVDKMGDYVKLKILDGDQGIRIDELQEMLPSWIHKDAPIIVSRA